MPYQTFLWNAWIDSLEQGDARLFMGGLVRAVRKHQLLKGKNSAEICKQYGDRVHEEVVQNVALKLFARSALDIFRDQAMSDKQIDFYIRETIANVLIDMFKKRRSEPAAPLTSGCRDSDDEYAEIEDWSEYISDSNASPEELLETQELFETVTRKLTQRQLFILHNYKKFQGDKSGAELGEALNVSVKTIELEVGKIKAVFRSAAGDGYS